MGQESLAMTESTAKPAENSHRSDAALGPETLAKAPAFADLFRRAGYCEEGISQHFGVERSGELARWEQLRLVHHTRDLGLTSVCFRLFWLLHPVARKAVEAVFDTPRLEEWIEAGFVGLVGDKVVPRLRLTIFGHLVIASDLPMRVEENPPTDQVMGIAASTRTLAQAMSRAPCRRFLDLGTGCGLLALLASEFAEEVVGSDLNPRAVQFARFNAALNGIPNATFVEGSLFEPFQGTRFDRIVGSPPFVLAPGVRLIYRDGMGGMRADHFCRQILREAPDYLHEGGLCQLLCNWGLTAGEVWQAPLEEWFAGLPADVLTLCSEVGDSEVYASAWIANTETCDADGGSARLEAWLRYHREIGIERIAAGLVNLRKRSLGTPWRAYQWVESMNGPAGASIAERFSVEDLLHDPISLEETRVTISPSARLYQRLALQEGGWQLQTATLRLETGLDMRLAMEPSLYQLLVGCDGGRTIGELADGLSRDAKEQAPAVRASIVHCLGDLLKNGFLQALDSSEHAQATPTLAQQIQ